MEIRDLVDDIDAWECRVVYPVLMTGDRRESYRLVTMFVSESGIEVGQDRTDHVMNELLPGLTYEPEESRECAIVVFARYQSINKRNPPTCVEDAEFWLENHLRPKQDRLADQLEDWTEEDFETPDEYWSWRERAANAFSRTRNEITATFAWISNAKKAAGAPPPATALLREVKKKNRQAEQASEAQPSPEAIQMIGKLRLLTAEKEASVRALYQPLFTPNVAPANATEAHERWKFLKHLRDDTENWHKEILAVGKDVLSNKQLKDIRRPIFNLDEQMHDESVIVQRYLQAASGSAPEVLHLLTVIDRVVSEGFELTESEYRFILHLSQRYGITTS